MYVNLFSIRLSRLNEILNKMNLFFPEKEFCNDVYKMSLMC